MVVKLSLVGKAQEQASDFDFEQKTGSDLLVPLLSKKNEYVFFAASASLIATPEKN